MKHILCLDIGGTTPRLAMVAIHGFDNYKILFQQKADKNQDSIIPAINQFLNWSAHEKGWTTNTCVASVAGPVFNNSCEKPTNAKFPIIGSQIQHETACNNVLVINDFAGIGEAVATLHPPAGKLMPVPGFQEGDELGTPTFIPPPDTHGPRGVIGPGTGLGIAYLRWEGSGYAVHPSEGGHAGIDGGRGTYLLLEFIRNKLDIGKISAETLVSGQGIRHIAHFLLTHPKSMKAILATRPAIAKDIAAFEQTKQVKTTDKEILTAILTENADGNLQKDAAEIIAHSVTKSPAALLTMRLFMEFLGSAAQDLALQGMTTGGLFLAGGILPRNKEILMKGDFMRAFYDNWKESSRNMLRKIPVYLIEDYDISFYGCARAGDLKFHDLTA
ncbi:MAG: glucokinase [Nanoarchaeota archaeon]